jgi:cleavage and polyadenylation specificity factor subunit 4
LREYNKNLLIIRKYKAMVLSVLEQDTPITTNTIEYDFEKFALQHGIPETLDPLPYRKTGSVFSSEYDSYGATNSNNNNSSSTNPNSNNNNTSNHHDSMLTSAKHDPRLRTVVCRHWLRDLCMKGAACEFLHQYDLSKMPLCRHGERCKIKDCPFRHISEGERMECAFYKSGFCIHGPFCRYKHAKRPREELPIVADFALGLSQMQAARDGEKVMRRPAPKPNEFYKISLCKHFMSGECPFGDSCHFAHGEHELKIFPRKQDNIVTMEDGTTNISDHVFGNQNMTEHITIDYFQGGAAGGGKPCPIVEPDQAFYFLLCAPTQRDLAFSTVRKEWYVQPRHAGLLNTAYGTSGSNQVMIFFTVSSSRHIQGAALMTSPCMYQAKLEQKMDDKDNAYSYRFLLDWYRTTEFPIRTALEVAPDLIIPTRWTQHCQDMSAKTGESLMKAVWNSPLVSLYESWSDEVTSAQPPVSDIYGMDLRAPSNDEEIAWPTMPGPGYIFGCSSDTMDECLGLGIFGLPAHMKASASGIDVGTTIFLFNVTDRLLFGIFEALTPAMMNISPTAFSKNPKATSSPFPVQVRVRISLECPPLEDTDPILNDILRTRGGGRIGPLTHAQSEAVASLLANQCGALQYMLDYQKGVQEGSDVRAPPIALPPRKIVRKETTGSDNEPIAGTVSS